MLTTLLVATPLALSTENYHTTRRSITSSASAAVATSILAPKLAAKAAAGPGATDLVAQVGDLSLKARELQFYVRESAPSGRHNYGLLRKRVTRERRQSLQQLLAAMDMAAPDLKICAPAQADCDCLADPELMGTAKLQVAVVREQLDRLDAALAQPEGFEELSTSGGALVYPGGAVERSLEMICEAADLYLDLASGRPLMTARIGLL